MEIIVEDFKRRYYQVYAIPDCGENTSGYWCMVHRAVGEMEYEDCYSTDFCVHPEDCNCEDEIEVAEYIQSLFYEEDSFHDLIYTEDALKMLSDTDNDEFDENNECENQKEQEKEIAKGLLNEYEHIVSPQQCAEVASKMAEFIRKNF